MLFAGLTPLAAVEAKRAHREVAGVLPQVQRYCRDLRRSTNLAVPLDGWYSPQGLLELARQDIDQAEDRLQREAFIYGFPPRPYQRRGIEAVEGRSAMGSARSCWRWPPAPARQKRASP